MLSAIEIMEERAIIEVEQFIAKAQSAREHLVWSMSMNGGTEVTCAGNARHTAQAFESLAEAFDYLRLAEERLAEIQRLIKREKVASEAA